MASAVWEFRVLLPHDLVLYSDDGKRILATYQRNHDGGAARLPMTDSEIRLVEVKCTGDAGTLLVPFATRTFGEPVLPPPTPGVLLVVSLPVLDRVMRADLVAPDTGSGAVRDTDGNVIGVTKMITAPQRAAVLGGGGGAS